VQIFFISEQTRERRRISCGTRYDKRLSLNSNELMRVLRVVLEVAVTATESFSGEDGPMKTNLRSQTATLRKFHVSVPCVPNGGVDADDD
jgi:hypothetical protein